MAVPALTDDLDVVLGLQDHLQAAAEQRVVVHDQNADGIGGALARRGVAGGGWTGHRRGSASLGILAHLSRGVEGTPLPPFTVASRVSRGSARTGGSGAGPQIRPLAACRVTPFLDHGTVRAVT
ncbi:hypothetical protein GCM10023085_30400 [Actinomadura viridis]